MLSQVTKYTFQEEDINITNTLIKHLKKHPKLALKYTTLHEKSLEIIVY